MKVNAVLIRSPGSTTPSPCCGSASTTDTSCASSSRCRWTPDTSGGAAQAIAADDVLAALRRHFTLTPDPAPRGSAPAELWRVDGGPATVGVIASVSHAFCSACDRTRLTADGQVRNCLFAGRRPTCARLMRAGADDDAIEAAWRAAMWAKAAGHGINDPDFVQPDRPMSAIGG